MGFAEPDRTSFTLTQNNSYNTSVLAASREGLSYVLR
jgi:hypothetical protein